MLTLQTLREQGLAPTKYLPPPRGRLPLRPNPYSAFPRGRLPLRPNACFAPGKGGKLRNFHLHPGTAETINE
jgi:hypothetical protein